MQKFLSFFAAAVMVAAGLVAGSGAAANATHGYGQHVGTDPRIQTPDRVERCDRTRVGVRIVSNSARDPKGKVLLVVNRDKKGFRYSDVKKYRGEKIWFRTPKLCKRGGYTVKVKFSAKPGSRWSDSKHFDAFRVTRRR